MDVIIGSIVAFRDAVSGVADHPAIVTGLVVPNKPNHVYLTVFYNLYTMSGVEARYSEERLAGTWSWPVRSE